MITCPSEMAYSALVRMQIDMASYSSNLWFAVHRLVCSLVCSQMINMQKDTLYKNVYS